MSDHAAEPIAEQSLTLAAFLNARFDEDERIAREANVKQDDPEWWCSPVIAAQASGRHGAVTVRSRRDSRPMARVESCSGDEGPADITDGTAVAAHIARHDPARALREATAKRAILAQWMASPPDSAVLTFALHNLAAVYSDHPDYREEWKP